MFVLLSVWSIWRFLDPLDELLKYIWIAGLRLRK